MTLPDGSAVLVDWRNGPSSVAALCGSAERAARLFDGDLAWVGKPTAGSIANRKP
jgi:hypothetical protein